MSRDLQQIRIGIVGATGAVGREMLAILERMQMPTGSIRCLASERSAGTMIPYPDEDLQVQLLQEDSFAGLDVVLLAASADISRTWAPVAVAQGTIVIDNSSAFRADPNVPLVIPEVNPDTLADFKAPGIIANPNCSTIIALMAVAPIHRVAKIQRMSVATYQAVSGAGAAAMAELEQQAREHAAGEQLTSESLPSQALFNVFCHESPIGPDGFNEEERKLRFESRRILDDPDLKISATCVRVGVPRAHSMAIELELGRPLDADDARRCLEAKPGIRIVDDRTNNVFPEPLHAAGGDDVLVGRIRNHPDSRDGRGLLLFACGDQLRKGAALNAIQILAHLLAINSAFTAKPA